MAEKTPLEIVATRQNDILEDRGEAISRNLLALRGGEPYIRERLERHPCESDVSWDGGAANGMDSLVGKINGAKGRKDRAYLVNYASRIVTKRNQYVFGQGVKRAGIDPEFEDNADLRGSTLNTVMQDLSAKQDAAGWSWLQVDAPALPTDENGNPIPRSQAEKEKTGARVFWRAWGADSVPDWKIRPDGSLAWIITAGETYIDDDPMAEAKEVEIRTLWLADGSFMRLRIDESKDGKKVVSVAGEGRMSTPVCPFIPCGVPDCDPIPFDDIERIQAQLLNLSSAHSENLLQTVYPQLVLPASIIDDIIGGNNTINRGQAVRMVMGRNHPILERSEDRGTTRYLTPATSDLEAIPREIDRLRRELFEVVGLMLSKDSAAAESAEAKAWDRLDPQAVLAERAQMLEAVERRAVELSVKIDSTFATWEPQYPRTFDIGDIGADMAALLNINQLDLPESAKRETMRAAVKVLNRIKPIPSDTANEIDGDINDHDFAAAFSGMLSDLGQTTTAPDGTEAAPVAPSAPVSETALNGAQVTGLVDLAAKVAIGSLPLATAESIADAAFPAIDPATLAAIFAPLASFKPKPEPQADPAAT